jgi:hypothetical protein
MTAKNRESRCRATTKSGKPCRAAATEGGLCFFHANPNKAVELGRIGGRKNGHVRSEVASSLPALETTSEVRETVARLIQDLYSGEVHPRVASGLASLLNLQLRVLETSGLERRVARLEKLLARTEEASAAGEIDLGDVADMFPERPTGPDEGPGKNGKLQPS